MNIYFIRHGETGGNVAKRHQHEQSHLTERGVAQAASAAAVAAALNPTHLIVSDRVRAVETGQAVAAATDLIPDRTPLFAELCRPQEMYGFRHFSRKSLVYLVHWFAGAFGGDDCGPAGESYAAFRSRLAAARAYLEALPPESRVVIVSHSVFITLFVAHLTRTKPLSWFGAARHFLRIKGLPNGSITHLTFDPTRTRAWQLKSFGKQVR
jgi:broad specificity phosphatase PhoE